MYSLKYFLTLKGICFLVGIAVLEVFLNILALALFHAVF